MSINKISGYIVILAFSTFAFLSSYQSFFSIEIGIPDILVFLLMIGIVACFFKNYIKIDLLLPLLFFIRFVFFSLAILITKNYTEEMGSELIISVVCLLVYFLAKELRGKVVVNSILIISIVTSIELVIVTFFLKNIDKSKIIVAIGGSNYAASFLLLGYTLSFNLIKSKKSLLVLVIITLGLLLTKSMAAYVVMVIVTILSTLKNPKSFFRRIKKKRYFVIGFLALFIAVIANLDFLNVFFHQIELKMELLFEGDLENFSSSRFELYRYTLNNIKNNPFGCVKNSGTELSSNYRFYEMHSHNIFMESLVKYGIFGSLINVLIVIYMFVKIKNNYKYFGLCDKVLLATIFVGVLHGLVEPNFFTMRFDILIFLILGHLTGNYKLKYVRYRQYVKYKYGEEYIGLRKSICI